MPAKAKRKKDFHHSRITHFDLELAEIIKSRRIMLGLTQEDLASAAGVTFQQIQKYENATNRVSASRLISIAGALQLAPGYFFEKYNDDGVLGLEKDILDLIKAYKSIQDPALKKQILKMMKQMSQV